MKITSPLRLVCALSLLVSASSSHAALAFQTIDMAAIGKGNAVFNTASITYGSPTVLGGVPFIVTDQPNQVWSSHVASGGGYDAVSETFPMTVGNIYGFYTLANTFWGINGTSTTQYRFDFTDDTFVTVDLIDGVDLRDFNNATWSNTINGTTTVNVANEPSRLDRQWIDLAALGYGGKDLESFTVTDTGGYEISRIFLVAATAQVGQIGQVPEVASGMLTAIAGLGLVIRRRR
jgi:hypothetical protein